MSYNNSVGWLNRYSKEALKVLFAIPPPSFYNWFTSLRRSVSLTKARMSPHSKKESFLRESVATRSQSYHKFPIPVPDSIQGLETPWYQPFIMLNWHLGHSNQFFNSTSYEHVLESRLSLLASVLLFCSGHLSSLGSVCCPP